MQPNLSGKRKCEVPKVPRSAAYYRATQAAPDEELVVKRLIDELHVRHSINGSRRIIKDLEQRRGYRVNRKRLPRLMLKMYALAKYLNVALLLRSVDFSSIDLNPRSLGPPAAPRR